MSTKLIITVDTEEEGLWSDSFRAHGNTVRNTRGIPSFQAVCENHGLAPVYLINSPVVADDDACQILKTIHDKNKCEIGCHIHPWNTPPVDENAESFTSYLCNLEPTIQAAKIERVTKDIERRFGRRPTSFRAGRYGLDSKGAKILKNLGYKVDSSVCPFTDYSDDGGPDFRNYPWVPYYIGESLAVPTKNSRSLLEVPVSFGFNWHDFNKAFKIYEVLERGVFKVLRGRGVFSRLNVLNKYKFSPEKHPATDLKLLAANYAKNNHPCLVMMFHSSSLVPGYSPYVTDQTELRNFLDCIDETIDYCLSFLNMKSNTLLEFGECYI